MNIHSDIVSKTYQDEIENVLLSTSFPWYYNYKTNEIKDSLCNKLVLEDNFQFTHLFYNSADNNKSMYLDTVMPLVHSIAEKENLYGYRLIRLKANLSTYKKRTKKFQIPHVDFPKIKDYKIAVYYVNDSDGDTIVFNETIDNVKKDFYPTVASSISPKKGSVVVFDGKHFHSGNYPSKNKTRVVLNIVYEK